MTTTTIATRAAASNPDFSEPRYIAIWVGIVLLLLLIGTGLIAIAVTYRRKQKRATAETTGTVISRGSLASPLGGETIEYVDLNGEARRYTLPISNNIDRLYKGRTVRVRYEPAVPTNIVIGNSVSGFSKPSLILVIFGCFFYFFAFAGSMMWGFFVALSHTFQ